MRGTQARSSLLMICPDVFVGTEVHWGLCMCVCVCVCVSTCCDFRLCSQLGWMGVYTQLPHLTGTIGFLSPIQPAGSARAPLHLQAELRDQHWVFLPQHTWPRPGHAEGGLMTEGKGPQCCLRTKN